jgi:hypothetical protein
MRTNVACLILVACFGPAVSRAVPVARAVPVVQAGPVALATRSPGDAAPWDTTPWDACDHLDSSAGFGAARGWRCEAEALSREAVSGEWESALRAGREPASGVGLTAGWRRAWVDGAGPADDVEGWFMRRGDRHRLAVGTGRLTFAGRRQDRALFDARIQPLAPLLAGVRASLYPGERATATSVVFALHGGLGPWWAGFDTGPRAGDLRVSLGLRPRPDLVWTMAYGGSAPTVGIAIRRRSIELRAEETAHPLLGHVSRIRLVLLGGGQ